MFRRAVHVLTLDGIQVRFDPGLLVIVLLVGWTFQQRLSLRFALPVALGLAAVATVLLIASILAHELGHAIAARRRGARVAGITLFALGGVTQMDRHGRTPREALAVAALGPWVSLTLAACFGLTATLAEQWLRGESAAAIGIVAGLLGWINLGLAVFNLLPGAPLDGGRMLHAVLWRLTRDRRTATLITSGLGQLLGSVLIIGGFWLGLRATELLFTGLWSLVIGIFLVVAASAERRRA
jgi:Zn-dependent protease